MHGVEIFAKLLRSDPGDCWVKMRSVLAQRGIDPSSAALAFSVEQGDMSEFAVIVAQDRRVYQYSLYSDTDSWLDAQLIEWIDLTANWTESPYTGSIRTALSLLDAHQNNAEF